MLHQDDAGPEKQRRDADEVPHREAAWKAFSSQVLQPALSYPREVAHPQESSEHQHFEDIARSPLPPRSGRDSMRLGSSTPVPRWHGYSSNWEREYEPP